MAGALAGPSLIKNLAACDKTTRDRAVRALLGTWLPSQAQVSDDDMKKLWKGLFYCVWHADKAPAQTDLIEKLSSTIHALDPALALQYFSFFLLTMRREWTGIDRLRLDKFYLLIRRFLHCFYALLKKWSWDLDFTRRSMGVLIGNTFLADDKFQGNGVNYQVASVCLEELRPFLPVRKEVIEVVLQPFASVMGRVNDKTLVGKIKSNVFDVLMENGKRLLDVKKSGEDIDSGDDAVIFGTIALAMGFSKKFYELGSSAECFQGSRKVLLSLHEGFLKLEKDMAALGIEVSIPEANEGDEDEVPELIPIDHEIKMDVSKFDEVKANGSAEKGLKKSKKAKNDSTGSNKKTKKKKKRKENAETNEVDGESGIMTTENSESLDLEQTTNGDSIKFDETVISNLQMQFEKVAEEVGLDTDVPSACDFPKVASNGDVSKKRKRAKNVGEKLSQDAELTSQDIGEASEATKTTEKSAKRVRFSMKNNLVWKPHSPLPPQSLRLPPSVTPRGSALKKGIPPGPIREMPAVTKKVKKKAKTLNKARKVKKGLAVKRPKKLKSLSPQ